MSADTIACSRCGSLRTRDVDGGTFEQLLARLFRQRIMACDRCGWRGRVAPRVETAPRRRHRHRHAEPMAVPQAQGEVDLSRIDEAMKSKE